MSHVSEDRVVESTTTTGTGALVLAGALTGFRSFGSVCSVSDTLWYSLWAVDGSGNATGVYEEGLGTYSATNTLTRTTVLRSSNSNAAVSLAAGTAYVGIGSLALKTLQMDVNNAVKLLAASSTPTAPTSDLNMYARLFAGRPMLTMAGAVGIESALQPALFGKNVVMFSSQDGTTGTGSNAFQLAWTSNGTVTTPAPSSTSPAVSNQLRRSRYANVVTTTNQQLGPRTNVASQQCFWRGNAAGLGGFFFFSRFVVDAWAAASGRIFSGLTGASATASVCISDTVVNDTCGLWHDTTDSSTTFNLVTRNQATTTKTAITLSNAIAAGNAYDFYMYCAPNGGTIYARLDDLVNGVTYEVNTSTTLPTSTIFMGPQTQMSNGTANTTVNTMAIAVNRIYCESDR